MNTLVGRQTTRSRVLGALLLVFALAASAAQAGSPVFLIQTGTDAEGNPLFRVATASDPSAASLIQLAGGSQAVSKVSDYFTSVQTEKLYNQLSAEGLSAQDMATAAQAFKPDPIFVEVNSNTSGSYNDWASHFTVDFGNGKVQSYSAPRVVFPLNNDVTRSGDKGLIEQTLVHEIGHGVMAEAYGASNLPQTPLLGKQHSGGSSSDPQLALIEGWAEFVGAHFTGRLTVAQDPAGSISSDAYAKNSDGSYKNISGLYMTEGFVATLLYDICKNDASGAALSDITKVMESEHPSSLQALLTDVEQSYPDLAPTTETQIYTDSGGQAGTPPSSVASNPPAGSLPPSQGGGVPGAGNGVPTGIPGGYPGGYGPVPPGYYGQNPTGGVGGGATGGASSILSALGLVQGQSGSLISSMLPGIIGAAAGGLIGYKFGGTIGALVGAVGGYLVAQFVASNFLGGNFASSSYTLAPQFASPTAGGLMPPTGVPAGQGLSGAGSSLAGYGPVTYTAAPSGAAIGTQGVPGAAGPAAPATDLATAFHNYQAALFAAQDAARSGAAGRIKAAAAAYQSAYATYRAAAAAATRGH